MRALLFPLLLLTVIASAIGVVWSRHEGRRLFNQLQELERARDRMNVEWGQLQLEQSTYTTHGKIEAAARKRLHMRIPGPDDVRILQP